MIREGTDEDFYWETVGILPIAGEIIFASKTPTIAVVGELSTPGRRAYYQSIIHRVEKGKLKGTYCFATGPTTKRLIPLFSSDEETRNRYLQHIAEVNKMIKLGMLDLRAVPHINFSSGIVTKNLAMIHIKKPGTLETERVDFIEGRQSQRYKLEFTRLVNKLAPVTPDSFLELLKGVQRAYLETIVLPKEQEKINSEIVKANNIGLALREALTLPTFPKKSELKQLFKKHYDKNSKLDLSKGFEAMLKIVEKYPSLSQPVEAIVKTSATTFGTVALPTLSLDFDEKHMFIRSDPKGKHKNNLWRLLEYFILHEREDIHCGWGFYLFPGWRSPGKLANGPIGQFRSTVSNLWRLLRKNRLDHYFSINLGSSQDTWVLRPNHLSSNVLEMNKHMRHAWHLFKADKFGEAAKFLLEILPKYPNFIDAHLLLLTSVRKAEDITLSKKQITNSVSILSREAEVLKEARVAAERNFEEPNEIAAEQINKMQYKQQEIETCLHLIQDSSSILSNANIPNELMWFYKQMAKFMDRSSSERERHEILKKLSESPIFRDLYEKILRRLRRKFKHDLIKPADFGAILFEAILRFLTEQCDSIKSFSALAYKTLYYRWEEQIMQNSGVPLTIQREVRRLIRAEEKLFQIFGSNFDQAQLRRELGWSIDKYEHIVEAKHRLLKLYRFPQRTQSSRH